MDSEGAKSTTAHDASDGSALDEVPADGTSYTQVTHQKENSGIALVTGIKVEF